MMMMMMMMMMMRRRMMMVNITAARRNFISSWLTDDEEANGAKLTPTVLQPRVVVCDGVCHVCHRGVKWVIRADRYRKIKFCCLQSQTADPYLRFCGVHRDDVLTRFLFVEGPSLYHQGSAAALRVLSYLPLPYSAFTMLLPSPLTRAAHAYFANSRFHRFAKPKHLFSSSRPTAVRAFH